MLCLYCERTRQQGSDWYDWWQRCDALHATSRQSH